MKPTADWRAYVNKLSYCYGCGRFGKPPPRKLRPVGWKALYQPHPDAPPGLLACSKECVAKLQEAMKRGPVYEPLASAMDILMPAEERMALMDEVKAMILEMMQEESVPATPEEPADE